MAGGSESAAPGAKANAVRVRAKRALRFMECPPCMEEDTGRAPRVHQLTGFMRLRGETTVNPTASVHWNATCRGAIFE